MDGVCVCALVLVLIGWVWSMHSRMDGCGWMDGWMGGWVVDGWMDEWLVG
jgi:hypothetical protein